MIETLEQAGQEVPDFLSKIANSFDGQRSFFKGRGGFRGGSRGSFRGGSRGGAPRGGSWFGGHDYRFNNKSPSPPRPPVSGAFPFQDSFDGRYISK